MSKRIANPEILDNLAFINFAKNLLRDYDAVNNAAITTYNGQVEAQVNRLKNIKKIISG